MASGTLERCSLHGWITVFTVQGRWQTACMALCGWAVCWCRRCGSSGPLYGMSRRMLWTTKTSAFYWWHFECTEIPWRDLEAHCCAIHPRPSPHVQHDNAQPHVARICTQFLEAENIPVLAWPACSLDMSPIEHVWDALDRRIRQRVPVAANIQQLRTAIEEEWTNIPQATINNLITSMWRRCVALSEANGCNTPDTDWFDWYGHPPPPNTVKLHILEWPFIVASLRHTCAIIMLFNQHLDMPHRWGGWIISVKEKCSLTQI